MSNVIVVLESHPCGSYGCCGEGKVAGLVADLESAKSLVQNREKGQVIKFSDDGASVSSDGKNFFKYYSFQKVKNENSKLQGSKEEKAKNTLEYKQGVQDFINGVGVPPYPEKDRQNLWSLGYADASKEANYDPGYYWKN